MPDCCGPMNAELYDGKVEKPDRTGVKGNAFRKFAEVRFLLSRISALASRVRNILHSNASVRALFTLRRLRRLRKGRVPPFRAKENHKALILKQFLRHLSLSP